MPEEAKNELLSAAGTVTENRAAEAVEKLMWLIADEMVEAFDSLYEPMLATSDEADPGAEGERPSQKSRSAGGRS